MKIFLDLSYFKVLFGSWQNSCSNLYCPCRLECYGLQQKPLDSFLGILLMFSWGGRLRSALKAYKKESTFQGRNVSGNDTCKVSWPQNAGQGCSCIRRSVVWTRVSHISTQRYSGTLLTSLQCNRFPETHRIALQRIRDWL